MLCQVCSKIEAKYTCPACEFKTCSSICVKKHKIDKKCSGKRQRLSGKYFPSKQLNTNILLDDQNLLEEAQASTDRIKRSFDGNIKHINSRTKKIAKLCKDMGINVCLMPYGMDRQKMNKSHIDKEGSLIWTIEWVELNYNYASGDPLLLNRSEILKYSGSKSYSKSPNKSSISTEFEKQFPNLSSPHFSFYLLESPNLQSENLKDIKSVRLTVIENKCDNFIEILSSKTIIEFPTIYYTKK